MNVTALVFRADGGHTFEPFEIPAAYFNALAEEEETPPPAPLTEDEIPFE